jgi:hypothetical protein
MNDKINPFWAPILRVWQYIDANNKWDLLDLLGEPKSCVVGEARGFSDSPDIIREEDYKCQTCIDIGNNFYNSLLHDGLIKDMMTFDKRYEVFERHLKTKHKIQTV